MEREQHENDDAELKTNFQEALAKQSKAARVLVDKWFQGFLDAFVYAHHKHRLDSENTGNFGDCMKGRVRFMTAITPAYAHAYQTTCLAQHFPGVPHQNFQLPKSKSRYPYLPNDRSFTSERGNDDRGWAIFTDGGTRVVDGETLVGWGVISRSPHGTLMS